MSAGGSRSGTRPSALVALADRGSHAPVLPGQRRCRVTGTPAAGLPRAVSSMCVVIGERACAPARHNYGVWLCIPHDTKSN